MTQEWQEVKARVATGEIRAQLGHLPNHTVTLHDGIPYDLSR